MTADLKTVEFIAGRMAKYHPDAPDFSVSWLQHLSVSLLPAWMQASQIRAHISLQVRAATFSSGHVHPPLAIEGML